MTPSPIPPVSPSPRVSRLAAARFLAFTGRRLSLLAAVLLLTVLGARAEDLRYFREVRTDGHYAIAGAYPISAEEAAKTNAYLFTYDNGQLIRLEFQKAGRPASDDFFEVPAILFSYQPGEEMRVYLDSQNQPTRKDDGVYGEKLTLNPQGFPITISNLDAVGNLTDDSRGVAQYARKLDDQGRVISTTYLNKSGKRIADADHIWEVRSIYDPQGQRVEMSTWNDKGDARVANGSGVAVTRTVYDGSGNPIEETYFDIEGNPTVSMDLGVHSVHTVYDSNGNIGLTTYYDTAGNLERDINTGAAQIVRAYDERGNQTELSYHDELGNLVINPQEGYAMVRTSFNDRNKRVDRSTYDASAQMIADNSGVAGTHWDYNEQGEVASMAFFDAKAQRTELPTLNAAIVKYDYRPDATRISFWDATGKIPREHALMGYAALEKPAGGSLYQSRFFDAQNRALNRWDVFFFNPYVKLVTDPDAKPGVRRNAIVGGFGLAFGCFIAAMMAVRGAVQAIRRKTYVPSRPERWISVAGLFLLGAGFILWLTSVQYVLEKSYSLPTDIFGPSSYGLIGGLILINVIIALRVMGTSRIYNIDRDTAEEWVSDFFRIENIHYRREGHIFHLTKTAELRVTYMPLSKHAYIFFKRRRHAPSRVARRLRRMLKKRAVPHFCAAVPWAGWLGYALGSLFFLGALQMTVYYLLQLIAAK